MQYIGSIYSLYRLIDQVRAIQSTQTGSNSSLVRAGQFRSQHVSHLFVVQDLILRSEIEYKHLKIQSDNS